MADPGLSDLQMRAIRELREHWREHGATEGCGYCELWQAWLRRDLAAFNAIIDRAGSAPTTAADDTSLDRLRTIVSEWGKASG